MSKAEGTYTPFVLRADSADHSQDVRWVAAAPDNRVLSASRDNTARLFHVVTEHNAFTDALLPKKVFEGHKQYVNCVLYHPAVPFLDGESAVITCANDKHIVLWNPETGVMEAVLDGHADGVRCMALIRPSMDIVTGGWDKLAISWGIGKGGIKQIFTEHKQAVLCAVQVDEERPQVLTGSGDKTVKAWNTETGEVSRTYYAHTDAVQCLARVNNTTFISGSNDTTICVWNLDSDIPQFRVMGHESLVFSLVYLPLGDEVASVSEDRTLRIWKLDMTAKTGTCKQVITHPGSIWSVSVLDSGDVVTGSSDYTIRLWTRNYEYTATPEKVVALEQMVAAQNIDIKSAVTAGSKLNVESLPSVNELGSIKGTYEGQRRPFRTDGNVVELYEWSNGLWSKIGTVVEGPDPGVGGETERPKRWYNGKYYDYLFNVAVGEGANEETLTLPYNRGQDVDEAAQNFIITYAHRGVTQDSKAEIRDFILQNIDPQDITLIQGDKRLSYEQALSSSAANAVMYTAPEVFRGMNPDVVKKKVQEFTGGEEWNKAVDDMVAAVAHPDAATCGEVIDLTTVLFSVLPQGKTIPAIDLLRYGATSQLLASSITAPTGSCRELFERTLLPDGGAILEHLVVDNEIVATLRLMANVLSWPGCCDASLVARILNNLVRPLIRRGIPSIPENMRAALLAVLRNAGFAVCDDASVRALATAVSEAIIGESNPDYQTKLLSCVWTALRGEYKDMSIIATRLSLHTLIQSMRGSTNNTLKALATAVFNLIKETGEK